MCDRVGPFTPHHRARRRLVPLTQRHEYFLSQWQEEHPCRATSRPLTNTVNSSGLPSTITTSAPSSCFNVAAKLAASRRMPLNTMFTAGSLLASSHYLLHRRPFLLTVPLPIVQRTRLLPGVLAGRLEAPEPPLSVLVLEG